MTRIGPVRIDGLLIGHVSSFGPNGEPSAIDKLPVSRSIRLETGGLAGDAFGDTVRHGGVDKALHHYPGEHYAAWQRELPHLPTGRWRAGGFGENLCPLGLLESDVCIGDIVRLGTAVLQVSQARQPCWKLNVRFGCDDMAMRVQVSGRTGWYYRVLEPGELAPGDEWILMERPHAQWPLARLLRYFYLDPMNLDALAAIAELDVLASSWRQVAKHRLSTGQLEDWRRRLDTPMAIGGDAAAMP